MERLESMREQETQIIEVSTLNFQQFVKPQGQLVIEVQIDKKDALCLKKQEIVSFLVETDDNRILTHIPMKIRKCKTIRYKVKTTIYPNEVESMFLFSEENYGCHLVLAHMREADENYTTQRLKWGYSSKEIDSQQSIAILLREDVKSLDWMMGFTSLPTWLRKGQQVKVRINNIIILGEIEEVTKYVEEQEIILLENFFPINYYVPLKKGEKEYILPYSKEFDAHKEILRAFLTLPFLKKKIKTIKEQERIKLHTKQTIGKALGEIAQEKENILLLTHNNTKDLLNNYFYLLGIKTLTLSSRKPLHEIEEKVRVNLIDYADFTFLNVNETNQPSKIFDKGVLLWDQFPLMFTSPPLATFESILAHALLPYCKEVEVYPISDLWE